MANRIKKAFFITFEGGEGTGKSTLINYLKKVLINNNFKVKVFREPGSTRIGEKIRKILLYSKDNIDSFTELLLYLAARTQLIREKLIKALSDYDVVICDRFIDSTLAYQGEGLGLGMEKIKPFIEYFSFGIKPDLTFLINILPKKSLSRIKSKDRIEKRNYSFHRRVYKGYMILAKRDPRRIKVIDNDESLEKAKKKILYYIKKRLCIKIL